MSSRDDAFQEISIALIEAVIHIKNYNNEAMCLVYLQKSVINKYNYLCKKHIKLGSIIDEYAEISLDVVSRNDFVVIEMNMDLRYLYNNKNTLQRHIIRYIVEDELSDSEVALKLNISRQYVNRIKKEMFKEYLNH